MLASVRSTDEAALALSCGADLIDCKDPSRGALGALEPKVIAAVRDVVDRRVLVSATIGDCSPVASEVIAAMEPVAATGVEIVKVGFQPGVDVPFVIQQVGGSGALQTGQGLVAVFFADLGFELDWVDQCAKAGFSGVMIDTAGKRAGGIGAHFSEVEAQVFIGRAHACGVVAGLAGGLDLDAAVRMKGWGADILGFRGGLCCQSNRQLGLDAGAIKALRRVLN
ncbi:MAG: (5-formylfuran-3-yl)methyl phosphate synthase [Pseudomonadota bacterium]